MFSVRFFRDCVPLFFGLSFILPCFGALNGCSGRPSSELTKEQLQKQKAENAANIADEDRLEAELKKKSRKR